MRDVEGRRCRVRRATTAGVPRTTTATVVAAATATTGTTRVRPATRAQRAVLSRRVRRPLTTHTTHQLCTAIPAEVRRRRIQRQPLTTRQPTTRTTILARTLVASTATTARDPDAIGQWVRGGRSRRGADVGRTTSAAAVVVADTAAVPPVGSRARRAADIDLQHLARRGSDAALDTTAAAADGIRRGAAAGTHGVHLQRRYTCRHGEGLRGIGARERHALGPARCARNLGAERFTRRADSDDLVVVRRADRQAAVLPRRRRGTAERDRVRQAGAARETPVDLPAGDRCGVGRRRPRDDVVALEAARGHRAGRVLQVLDRGGPNVTRTGGRTHRAVGVGDRVGIHVEHDGAVGRRGAGDADGEPRVV